MMDYRKPRCWRGGVPGVERSEPPARRQLVLNWLLPVSVGSWRSKFSWGLTFVRPQPPVRTFGLNLMRIGRVNTRDYRKPPCWRAVVASIGMLVSCCGVSEVGAQTDSAIEVISDRDEGVWDLSSASGVVLTQATEPATGSPQPTVSAPAPQPSSSNDITFDLLKGTVLSGFETYINAASTLGAGLSTAFAEPRTDATSLLKDLPGFAAETRSATSSAPILQGRRLGQVPARGSYWFPARQDIDTALGKIDARIVEQFTIIKGPYSALYGPGLSFYDVELLSSPRYQNGFQTHGSTSAEYQTNGEQWSGRYSVWGGARNWGFRVGSGIRAGNDYESGDGTLFPSSYKFGTADVAMGADLTTNSSIEFNYIRVNEQDVEIPNQYFDINQLQTDAYDIHYVVVNQPNFDRMTFETWYNRTNFDGDNFRPGKRNLLPLDNPFGVSFFSMTDVDASSRGYSLAFSWGNRDDGILTVGSDLRYLTQELKEFNTLDFAFEVPPFIVDTTVNNPIPDSRSSNPGLFVQTTQPVTSRLNVTVGGRVDWVSTNAVNMVDGAVGDLEELLGGGFNQHFDLWSAFITTDFAINDYLSVNVGGGHAERPPSMTELYAAGPFLAVIPQNVFTTLDGDPNLASEKMWQIDVSMAADYRRIRGGARGYYSWIEDYITFDFIDLPGSVLYAYLNTDLATLSGFEAYGEFDANRYLTLFSQVFYTEGRDHTRGDSVSTQRTLLSATNPLLDPDLRSGVALDKEPLPVIPPWESRLGVRLHQPRPNPLWAVEFSARVVNDQDRFARSLLEQATPGFTTYDIISYWQLFSDFLFTAGVQNLTDKNYQTHFDTKRAGRSTPVFVYQPGINFYFGAELTY